MKVSVLMPVYNGEKYLKEAIESILNQTFSDFEFIIVDDGSTDKTSDIIKSFNDNRIKYFKKENSGIVDSLNFGLGKSQGEFIVRMDADDVSNPERIQKLVEYMESNKNVSICGSWAEKINYSGESVGYFKYPPVENIDIKKYLLLHNPFIHPSVIFNRKKVLELGLYKKFKHNEDYELWTRLLKRGIGHNIPIFLIKYRIHENQITRKSNFKMKLTSIFVRILALLRY